LSPRVLTYSDCVNVASDVQHAVNLLFTALISHFKLFVCQHEAITTVLQLLSQFLSSG